MDMFRLRSIVVAREEVMSKFFLIHRKDEQDAEDIKFLRAVPQIEPPLLFISIAILYEALESYKKLADATVDLSGEHVESLLNKVDRDELYKLSNRARRTLFHIRNERISKILSKWRLLVGDIEIIQRKDFVIMLHDFLWDHLTAIFGSQKRIWGERYEGIPRNREAGDGK